eukprot:TRINITY_DN4203_c0_g1_i11.p1 TRINITY_DN4203_c0_g1~~TRINITY_DN4203_c0_g1_i11.p1  ORF type:complete len:108 (+),score=23.56 TRINITY_DN4203_c0_g1_i11:304-627(+)
MILFDENGKGQEKGERMLSMKKMARELETDETINIKQKGSSGINAEYGETRSVEEERFGLFDLHTRNSATVVFYIITTSQSCIHGIFSLTPSTCSGLPLKLHPCSSN